MRNSLGRSPLGRILLLWALSGAGLAGGSAEAVITRPGDYVFPLQHQGMARKYRIHVPAQYRPGTPAPLLFAFHGGGGDMNHQADDEKYRLLSKSEQAGFILIFPNGHSRWPSGKLATWNAGRCCGLARDERIDDVGFVRKVLEDVAGRLSIDRKAIFATGMSNGAMMAYRLACEMADAFKAVAAVAGTDNTISCAPKNAVSVLHIHARNDDRVLFGGGSGRTWRKSLVTDYTSVPATIQKWVKFNGCAGAPKRVLEVQGAYCERYSPCREQASVQLCVTDRGGHSWPGGKKEQGGEPPSNAISANDVMWDFFQAARARGASP